MDEPRKPAPKLDACKSAGAGVAGAGDCDGCGGVEDGGNTPSNKDLSDTGRLSIESEGEDESVGWGDDEEDDC